MKRAAAVPPIFLVLAGCGGSSEPATPAPSPPGPPAVDAGGLEVEAGPAPDAEAGPGGDGGASGAAEGCTESIGRGAALTLPSPGPGDAVLELVARSTSRTSWGEKGNEAVVLEAMSGKKKVGHIVLHQGAADFTYKMHVGTLKDPLVLSISSLSSTKAAPGVCVKSSRLQPSAAYGSMQEAIENAPIYVRPTAKAFDDLPVVVGYSSGSTEYVTVYTNENGGTTVICGGGADGLRAEIARWGRGSDIEVQYNVKAQTFERCTGSKAAGALHFEGKHPFLYYGNGHNVTFESRGGYGSACGTGRAEKADGDLEGWNRNNPGNDPSLDDPFVLYVRPVPEDLGVVQGHSEQLQSALAPWVYRLTDLETKREGKIDGKETFGLEDYLYADVWASGVDGRGDSYCSLTGVSGGFKLRALTSQGDSAGPQMTKDYFGGQPGVKRYALPIGKRLATADMRALRFDAYDGDGIYLLALGDAFFVRPVGDNGAQLEYVFKKKDVNVYVDDNRSSCTGAVTSAVNSQGPGGKPYRCVGGSYDVAP